jgi:hypothetical protein
MRPLEPLGREQHKKRMPWKIIKPTAKAEPAPPAPPLANLPIAPAAAAEPGAGARRPRLPRLGDLVPSARASSER